MRKVLSLGNNEVNLFQIKVRLSTSQCQRPSLPLGLKFFSTCLVVYKKSVESISICVGKIEKIFCLRFADYHFIQPRNTERFSVFKLNLGSFHSFYTIFRINYRVLFGTRLASLCPKKHADVDF